jgi:hypothetical protein
LYALNSSGTRLDVTITNHTGGPLTRVSLGEGATIERIEDGASASVSLPLTNEVNLSFVGLDGRARTSSYQYSNHSGIRHSMKIVLKVGQESPRDFHMRSTLLFGADVEYEESLDFIDSRHETGRRP